MQHRESRGRRFCSKGWGIDKREKKILQNKKSMKNRQTNVSEFTYDAQGMARIADKRPKFFVI